MTTLKEMEPYFALDTDGMNLISHLAQQMNHEAVDEMLKHGGSLADAIYGYASMKNSDQVNRLLATCDESNKKQCIGSALKGYARANDSEKVFATPDYRNYMADLVLGFAQAGNKSQVTTLLDRQIKFYSQAVEGYASANKGAFLKLLVKGTRFYPLAIFHAARAGHIDLVTDLLKECGVPPDFRPARSVSPPGGKPPVSIIDIAAYGWLNEAVKGYMAGRHFNEAIALLDRGASITHCLNELKDTEGKPTHDLYIAFLAHIEDASLREKVLARMAVYSAVQPLLTITPADLERLATVMTHMKDSGLNYLEACHKADDAAYEAKKGELTLTSLAELIDVEDNTSSTSSTMSV